MARINFRKVIYNLFEYLLAFSLVLDSRSMWINVKSFMSIANFFTYCLLILGISGCILSSKVYKKNISILFYIDTIFIIYIALYLGIYPRFFLGFARRSMSIICIFSYLYLKKENREQLFLKYSQIIVFIAAISLVFWTLSSPLSILHPTGYVYSYWSKSVVPSYFNLYFTPQMDLDAWGVLTVRARNCACFTEAPMSALNFGIALLIEVFIKKFRNKSHILILGIAMITTFSTLGYLLLIYIIAYLLFKSPSRYVIVKIIKILVIPVSLISLFFIARYITSSRLGTGSGMERTYDFIVGFRTWLSKPLFGYGYGNFDDLKHSSFSLFGIGTGFSNSVTPILCGGGLYFAIPILILIIRDFSNTIKYRNYNYLFFMIGLVFLYVFIISSYQWIIFALFFYMGDKRSYEKSPDIKVIGIKDIANSI